MRLRLFAAFLILAGCGPAARSTPEVMPEVAAELIAIYNAGDHDRLVTLFAPASAANAKRTRKHLPWIRERLGACEAPEFMWSHGKRRARWSAACERGALELDISLDAAGQVVALTSGAAGVAMPPELHAAAEAVLASLPWAWDTSRPFKHNLNLHEAIRLGPCTLVRPWVTGPFGALVHVRCVDDQLAVLSIGLGPSGTISEANLYPSHKVYRGELDL